ncbi:hypothetical protein EWI07_01725 [Sporolactobacillus sp. THM7-4]|nr:hypothetical protein EWI07_01725 [Sporolactobacillus sp. THM7-4]
MSFKNGLVRVFCTAFFLFGLFVLTISIIGPIFLQHHHGLFLENRISLIGISGALLLFALVILLFFTAVERILSLMPDHWIRYITHILAIVILTVELTVLILFKDILPPAIDGGHIYLKALELVRQKHFEDSIYFQVYPNNIPITVLRYWIYKIFTFGRSDLLLPVDRGFCALFLDIGIFFSWKVIVEQFGRKKGILFLLAVLTCFPLFFYTLYFYSDTVALMFPPLFLYLWIRYRKTKKLTYIILLGLCLAIGCQIRQNLVLFVPAFMIYLVFVLKLRHAVRYSAIVLSFLLIGNSLFPFYYTHLRLDGNTELKTPASHWVMMGLSEYGRYNIDDFKLTMAQTSRQEKKAVDWSEIRKRIEKKGSSGLFYLWAIKAARTFADGSMGYYWYTGNTARYSLTYDYLFGERKQLMMFVIQAFHIVNYIFLLLSSFRFIRIKKIDESLLVQICLFGNFLFYTFLWEAEPRYSLLFVLMFLIAGIYGLNEWILILDRIKKIQIWNRSGGQIPKMIAIGLCVAVAACAWINFDRLTQEPRVQKRYVVNQILKRGKIAAVVDRYHEMDQTFQACEPFNHISIGVHHWAGQGKYRMAVIAEGTHQVVATKEIESRSLKADRLTDFSFNRMIPDRRQGYRLQLRQISGSRKAELGISIHGKGIFELRDMYLGGGLFQDHRPLKNVDIQFQVYRLETRPYLHTGTFLLIFALPLLFLCLYVLSSGLEAKLR